MLKIVILNLDLSNLINLEASPWIRVDDDTDDEDLSPEFSESDETVKGN